VKAVQILLDRENIYVSGPSLTSSHNAAGHSEHETVGLATNPLRLGLYKLHGAVEISAFARQLIVSIQLGLGNAINV
jgi:hypothetical protein